MFLNRRSERPHAVLGVLPGCWRGLSGTPLGATSVLEEATWAGATKSTPTVSARRTPRSSSSSGYFLDRGITWSSLLEGQIPRFKVSAKTGLAQESSVHPCRHRAFQTITRPGRGGWCGNPYQTTERPVRRAGAVRRRRAHHERREDGV